MLRIYDVALEVVPVVIGLADKIAEKDRDQARQLRRSMLSVVNNLCEGSGHDGGTRRQRYKDALGSSRETIGNLMASQAAGYVRVDAEALDKLEHVSAVLIRILYM